MSKTGGEKMLKIARVWVKQSLLRKGQNHVERTTMKDSHTKKVAIITGASSGFGAAMAEHFASLGISIALGARRTDLLHDLQTKLAKKHDVKVFYHTLDVQSVDSVKEFVDLTIKEFGKIDYLINNAGLALGMDTVVDTKPEAWKTMWETNVLGSVQMIQAVLPHLKEHAGARVINIGSVSGHETYEGGGAYCSSKFALRAVTLTLRYEMMKKGIGVSSIDPGMAETEFSMVRLKDKEKAKKVYQGMKPLSPQDVAEIAGFLITRPAHVNIDQILVYPMQQSSGVRILRN